MTTKPIVHELTLAHIALDLGAPAAPPLAPPDPTEAVSSYLRCLANAQQQLAAARTREEQMDAEMWIDNAQRNLAKWQRALERTVGA